MDEQRYQELEKRIAALEKIIQEQQQIIVKSTDNESKIINSKDLYTYGGTMLL